MRWLFVSPLRPFVALAAVASLLLNLAMLMPSLYTLQVFDRVFTSRSVETLVMLSALTLAALVFGYCMDVARSRALASAGRTLHQLGRVLFVDPSLYRRVRERLIGAHRREGRVLVDYVLTPTEIHVVSQVPAGDNAGRVARAVGNVVARWVRQLQPVRSPILAGPYRAHRIASADELRDEMRMLAWRPVFLSLCSTPSHYPHSALRTVLGLTRAQGFDARTLLRLFGESVPQARAAMRTWMAKRPSEREVAAVGTGARTCAGDQPWRFAADLGARSPRRSGCCARGLRRPGRDRGLAEASRGLGRRKARRERRRGSSTHSRRDGRARPRAGRLSGRRPRSVLGSIGGTSFSPRQIHALRADGRMQGATC